jgi:hypothetical protein
MDESRLKARASLIVSEIRQAVERICAYMPEEAQGLISVREAVVNALAGTAFGEERKRTVFKKIVEAVFAISLVGLTVDRERSWVSLTAADLRVLCYLQSLLPPGQTADTLAELVKRAEVALKDKVGLAIAQARESLPENVVVQEDAPILRRNGKTLVGAWVVLEGEDEGTACGRCDSACGKHPGTRCGRQGSLPDASAEGCSPAGDGAENCDED